MYSHFRHGMSVPTALQWPIPIDPRASKLTAAAAFGARIPKTRSCLIAKAFKYESWQFTRIGLLVQHRPSLWCQEG
eukprot:2672163-Amphidinium_carterae.1